MLQLSQTDGRWQLYRLLSDPTRLRLLALAAEEELSVGELAELLNEPQPNVSRHAAPLRQAGLLFDRKQSTRTMIRLADEAINDAVIADAVNAGRALCEADGSLSRVGQVVARRDVKTREFFARPGKGEVGLSGDLPAYLSAFAGLLPARELAVDAGTGDGVLLDLLAPLYRRVIALDRSDAQLERASERVVTRGYQNVELLNDSVDGERITAAVGRGADLVVAARMLHHAPRPRKTLQELTGLARPGGHLLVIDYARHEDVSLSEELADVWLGFAPDELLSYAESAGVVEAQVSPLPPLTRSGPDKHIGWLCLLARRAETSASATPNLQIENH